MTSINIFTILVTVLVLIIPSATAITVTAEPLGTTLQSHSVNGITQYSFDASPDGKAIQRVGLDVPTGTEVTYIITYGSGSTATGTMHYFNNGFYQQTSEITLEGESSTYTYVGLQEVGRFYVSGYARNETSPGVWQTGHVIYGSTAGVTALQNDFVFNPITGDPTIYKIQITATNPINVAVFTAPRADVAAATQKSFLDVMNEWVQFATAMTQTVLGIVTSAVKWLKFFFIDNLGMTIALYITGSLVIAARTSRGNPIKVLRQFLKDQATLYRFMISMWESIVNIISNFRGIFRI